MDDVRIMAEPRIETGTGAARRLRRAGKIPAVLYGDGSAQPILVDGREFRRFDHGGVGILTLEVQGQKATTAMIKEIQRDPMRDDVTHVDFMKVKMTDTVHTTVPITLAGEAPGVKMGGVLQHALWEVEVQAQAKDIPSAIEVDISKLEMGGSIHVADLEAPSGVEFLTPPEASIVTILAPTLHVEGVAAEEEAPEEAAAEGAAGEEAAPAERAAQSESEG